MLLTSCRLARRPESRALSTVIARQRLPNGGWRTLTAQSTHMVGRRDSAPPSASTSLRQAFIAAVMPKGWPETTNTNYAAYVRWTAVGLVSGRVQSVLATQASLFAIGLGAGAVPMAAAIQWVLKDGVGHLGAIVYATAVNTRFDADAKRHRFRSVVAATAADAIAVVMPLWPGMFMPMASASAVLSSTSSVATVSARARIYASFSTGGNLADLSRAGQSQSKICSLMGTGLGATLSWVLGPEPLVVLAACTPLAAVSIAAMYRSSSLVVLPSLNLQRTELLFLDMLRQLPEHPVGAQHGSAGGAAAPLGATELLSLDAPPPAAIAREETFARDYVSVLGADSELQLQPLLGPATGGVQFWLRAGATADLRAVRPLLPSGTGDAVAAAADAAEASGGWCAAWHGTDPDGTVAASAAETTAAAPLYAIAHRAAAAAEAGGAAAATAQVLVWHRAEATAEAKLRAVWHACLLRHHHAAWTQPPDTDAATATATAATVATRPLDELHALAHASWPHALEAMRRSGWDVGRVYLDGDGACLEPG